MCERSIEMSDEDNSKSLAKEVYDLMQRALDADSAGDKETAIELYMKGADTYLKISDVMLKNKLQKFAIDAISRAEELKGVKSNPTTPISSPTQSNVQSACLLQKITFFSTMLNICISCHFL